MGVGSKLAVSELQAIAWQAARSQARRHPGADVDDLAQEALVAMCAAMRHVTASTQCVAAYLARVAKVATWLHGVELVSPLRHSKSADGLAQAARAAAGRVSDELLEQEAAPQMPAPDALNEGRWAAEVRAQVEKVLARETPDDRALLQELLLGGSHYREVAQQFGVPLPKVYVISQRACRRILTSARVRALWRDLPSRGE